jgi:hypothetical protein
LGEFEAGLLAAAVGAPLAVVFGGAAQDSRGRPQGPCKDTPYLSCPAPHRPRPYNDDDAYKRDERFWHSHRGKQKNILKVICFHAIIRITCLNHFDGYIGCEEHGQLAEALLSRTM